ncbi:MAG: Tudor-knot domain-containing protein [Cyanobacteriota bacterium]|nr:Tudor-knot domain-containing protein [Cyanobacteriota bacterium]
MSKSIIQLVDELPTNNITVKALKAMDYIMPGEWNNLVGFENNIRSITGETDPQQIQRIRDRAVSLYHDPQQGYQTAIKLYQTIDKADAVMATAALANKIGEKISFLSFLSNFTPKADLTQTIDLLLKITVEIIAFCKLNGIPQPNPQVFAATLTNNYQDAALMRMIALVCFDAILPLGPDFIGKVHSMIDGADSRVISQNQVFNAISNTIPGNDTSDKFGFIKQGFNSIQGWMNNLVVKTGITPQSVLDQVGSFIQIADDNLDFVAAFLDQTTNYYEHTGIQTVTRKLILDASASVQPELLTASGNLSRFAVGETVEVWDKDKGKWYKATIQDIKVKKEKTKYFVHYISPGADEDDWVKEKNIRSR